MLNKISEVSTLIDELLNKSAEGACAESHDYTDETILNLELLKQWKPFWSIEIQHEDIELLNRKGNLLGGLPFISEEHPWPLNDQGQPYLPLLQISLDEVSLLSGQDFGLGLLQVWLDINDSDLPNVVRVIERSDLNAPMMLPTFDYSEINVADHWDQACAHFSIIPGGFMCTDFGAHLIESRNRRELTNDESIIIDQLMEIVEKSNYGCPAGDWVLGYPDKGSGTPAGRYDPEPDNFFQFNTANSFSRVNVSRYANIFFDDSSQGVSFFFDWGG
jgi:hypothetical protein